MKAFYLSCICIFASLLLLSQSQGPKTPGTVTNSALAGNILVWNNPSNAKVSDNSYADFDISSGLMNDYTDYLLTSDFGFTIPVSSTIDGIVVEIERSDPESITADYSIRLVKAGSIGDAEYSTAVPYPVSDSYQSYGGVTDLWGESWTAGDINSSNFGVAISAQLLAKGDVLGGQVDNVRITVFYTLIILPLKLSGFSATPGSDRVRLTWSTNEENGMDHFELQRSANANNFTGIGNITCTNRPGSSNYSFDDMDPVKGTAWYRLKMFSNNGSGTYSKIVSAQFKPGYNISLYPSSLQAGNDLFVINPSHEWLNILFFNNSGQLSGNITTSTNQLETATLTSQKGLYYYRIMGENGELKGSGKLIVY